MRNVEYNLIVNTVEKMCMDANYFLPEDTFNAIRNSYEIEESETARSILEKCIENAEIAANENMAICQDTGLAVFFIKLGVDVRIVNGRTGLIYDAVNDGVASGYEKGFLRKSVLSDPLYDRKNTGNNLPAVIHMELTDGEAIEIIIAPKGGGAENMSRLAMLAPSDGEKGIIDFVVETVRKAGGNPCPPVVLGVGIGGNFENSALLAKKALLWPAGERNSDERYDRLEKLILDKVNNTGIGPQGLGGRVTCLSVHIEWQPCHLASLPVAVNINCHAHRHVKVVI
ncbi:MAG: fumarate hydratase [Spirochaetes bacterium]|nr:fumarate hydratase [Spirochaetota bacterium]